MDVGDWEGEAKLMPRVSSSADPEPDPPEPDSERPKSGCKMDPV